MLTLLLSLLTMLKYGDACTYVPVPITPPVAITTCASQFNGFLLSLINDSDITRLEGKMDKHNDTMAWIGLEKNGCRWTFQAPDEECPNTMSAFRCINEDYWLYRKKSNTRYRPRCVSEGGYSFAYYDRIRGGVDNDKALNVSLPCACCQRGICSNGKCRYLETFVTLPGQWTINGYVIWICDGNGKYNICCNSNTPVTVSMADYASPRAYVQDVCKNDCNCV